jgi:hypothetical protein
MRVNWKVLVALALMVGAVAWAVTSITSTSYSGANLDFSVGTGTVTMTNPSSDLIPVRLSGPANRSFSVSSTIDGMPRSSTREDTASLIEFELPPGISEFTIARGTDVTFIAETDTNLEATLHAANIGTKIKVLAGTIVVLLFYISYTTEHRWIYKLFGKEPVSKLHSKPYTGEQDVNMRPYGDNRVKGRVTPVQCINVE